MANQAGSSASGAMAGDLAALWTNSSLPPRPQSHRTPCCTCTGCDATRERLLLHAVRSAASSIACGRTSARFVLHGRVRVPKVACPRCQTDGLFQAFGKQG